MKPTRLNFPIALENNLIAGGHKLRTSESYNTSYLNDKSNKALKYICIINYGIIIPLA